SPRQSVMTTTAADEYHNPHFLGIFFGKSVVFSQGQACPPKGHAEVADRARLRRAQARARADALRRARVARLPPSRDADDRRLRLSGRRARPFFPLRSWRRRAEAQSGSPTPRFPTPRQPRSGPRGPSGGGSRLSGAVRG